MCDSSNTQVLVVSLYFKKSFTSTLAIKFGNNHLIETTQNFKKNKAC